ncbi:MAG: hypothetical protein D5R97_07175 [Candidatus Syntrophonatronum acetioxidans]|uniref:Uncharacterized protein n=1 Tax=Candidatus Syntrophonatronum acetioxidans TaxID=1795816 RepID=A0A424YCN2_9FIRM|nr:MAG: hypothetical protein D5R97_07175 [Candidatus Syntrophonatronum acetioxidans]
MHTLYISLLDGFEDEMAIIKVNGDTVFQKEAIFSKLSKGYAEEVEVQVDEGDVEVEFSLPLRDLSERVTIKVLSPIYLGFSLHHEKIQYKASLTPLLRENQ